MAFSARRGLPRFCLVYEMERNIRRVKERLGKPEAAISYLPRKLVINGFKPAQNTTHQDSSPDHKIETVY